MDCSVNSLCPGIKRNVSSYNTSDSGCAPTPAPAPAPTPPPSPPTPPEKCDSPALCAWVAESHCGNSSKYQEPHRNVGCNVAVPACQGSAGFCDCNGDGEFNNNGHEERFDCDQIESFRDPVCRCKANFTCAEICCTTTTTSTTTFTTTTTTSSTTSSTTTTTSSTT